MSMDGLPRCRSFVLEDYSLVGWGVWGWVGSDERVELWYGLGGEGRSSSGLYVLRIRTGLKLELASLLLS